MILLIGTINKNDRLKDCGTWIYKSFFPSKKIFFPGNVAFIAGGDTMSDVEIYSPNGLCSAPLEPMPKINYNHALFWRKKEIIACGGSVDFNCYIYFITNNSWTLFSQAGSSYPPYTMFNNKVFFGPWNGDGQVLDFSTMQWSTWPAAPYNNYAGCQVTYRDTFIRFGGYLRERWVYAYNHTTQNWTLLTDQSPMKFQFSGCTLLEDDRVLVAGSIVGSDMKNYTVYDIKSNQWIFNGTFSFAVYYTTIVTLGKRIFMIKGANSNPIVSNHVMEFHPSNYSFTDVGVMLGTSRTTGAAAVSVPARLFRNILPTCTGVS